MSQNLIIPVLLFVCARLYSPLPATNPVVEAMRKSGSGQATSTWIQSVSLAQAIQGSNAVQSILSMLPSSWLSGEHGFFRATWLEGSVAMAIHGEQYVLSHIPEYWYNILLYMSPVFSLLEGLSSLLVIQSVSHLSRWLINDTEDGKRSRQLRGSRIIKRLLSFGLDPSEVWQLLFLMLSAIIYVAAVFALYICFDGAFDGRPITAAAIGASLASTLWISGIAFTIRKANVVETSLMFAYVVFNIYQLNTSMRLGTDPLQMVRAFKASRLESHTPFLLATSTDAFLDRLVDAVEHSLHVLSAASEVLPKTVIVSLVFRLMVLYSAIRVLPRLDTATAYDVRSIPTSDAQTKLANDKEAQDQAKLNDLLKKAKEPGSPGAESVSSHVPETLSKAPTAPREKARRVASAARPKPDSTILPVLVTYSRFVLIAVYSHLLLLDQNHQIYWRLLTVFFTLCLWSVELLMSKEEAPMAAMYE
ncbi:hypothetical protein MVES1_000528 [Malassezia vespertilionis]|uniref:Uncharacterized protein n=1 Tax=Malassezia vespertilionis TaxID=2020962 RepID=A0A2N1JGA4_9BASI|nr:uncharacterized protein MVES1_000528 [Malassezia vespertilionis]PKI85587.1 hypothetical protein MVES_000486 [Malassezia vespertilionis]WFD05200.1 hypothetical protein MVES1_000528 [Malassezia vespertilionis]